MELYYLLVLHHGSGDEEEIGLEGRPFPTDKLLEIRAICQC